MDIMNLSQNDDSSDTSQEEIEDDDVDFTGARKSDSISTRELSNACFARSFERWKRPSVTPLLLDVGDRGQNQHNIEFMLVDCDFGLGVMSFDRPNQSVVATTNPDELLLNPESNQDQRCCIRLYGVTNEGHSVCCHVFNFQPYFFAMPVSSSALSQDDILTFKEKLNLAVREKMVNDPKSVLFHKLLESIDPITSIELMADMNLAHEAQRGIFDFVELASSSTVNQVLQITCLMPKFVWTAGQLLGKGGIGLSLNEQEVYFEPFESSINHNIRFLTDQNISTGSWLRIPRGKYFLRTTEEQKLSYAQLELDVSFDLIQKMSEESRISPLRILSFDLEVMTRPPIYKFPRDGVEQILTIGNTLSLYSRGESGTKDELPQTQDKVVFTLNSCNDVPGTRVFSYETEVELLESWRSFLLTFDPEIITGYNIKRFDFPYLLARANYLNITKTVPFLGRLKRVPCRLRHIKNVTKAFDRYTTERMNLNGRILLDAFLLIKRHNTVPAYSQTKNGQFTLDEVAKRYLNETKEDVSYHDIFDLYNSGSAGRKKLAAYCVQDSVLPYSLLLLRHFPSRISAQWDFIQYYFQKARDSGVPLKYLVNMSTDYHNYCKLIRQAKNPSVKFNSPPKRNAETMTSGSPAKQDALPLPLPKKRVLDFSTIQDG